MSAEIYMGVTTDMYHKAMATLSDRMFQRFDEFPELYKNGNRGLNFMWNLSWTASFVARESVEYMIKTGETLENSIIKSLLDNCGENSYIREDLLSISDNTAQQSHTIRPLTRSLKLPKVKRKSK